MKSFFNYRQWGMVVQAVTLAIIFTISHSTRAEMPAPPTPIWGDVVNNAGNETQISKDARRDPNTYCVNCHGSISSFQHAGKHFHPDTLSPNNGKSLNCTSCHGNISETHRKGVKDVMRFQPMGEAKNPTLARSVQEQNQICFACHNPDKLREVFWAHDTHATKITCVNCHQIHPEKEPMKNSNPKQRIKLCVDCHSKIHQNQHQSEQTKDSQ